MNRQKTTTLLALLALMAAAFPATATVPEHVPCADVEFCEEQIDPRAVYVLAYGIEMELYLNSQAALYEAYGQRLATATAAEASALLTNVAIMSSYLGQMSAYTSGQLLPYAQTLDDAPVEFTHETAGYVVAQTSDVAAFLARASDVTFLLSQDMSEWQGYMDETDGKELPAMPPFSVSNYLTVPPSVPPVVNEMLPPPPPPPVPPELYVPGQPEPVPTPADYPLPDFEVPEAAQARQTVEDAVWEAIGLGSTSVSVGTTAVAATDPTAGIANTCPQGVNPASNPNGDIDGDGLSNGLELHLIARYDDDLAKMFSPCHKSSDGDGIPDGRDFSPGVNSPLKIKVQVTGFTQGKYMDCCDYWWGAGKYVWGEPYLVGGVQWGTSTNDNQGGYRLTFERLKPDEDHHEENQPTLTAVIDPDQATGDLKTLDLPQDIRQFSSLPPKLSLKFALADHDGCRDDIYPNAGDTNCLDNPNIASHAIQAVEKPLTFILDNMDEVAGALSYWAQPLQYTDGGTTTITLRVRVNVGVGVVDECLAVLMDTTSGMLLPNGNLASILTTTPPQC